MSNQYLVGVDIGTTGAKGIVIDLAGNVIGSGYHEYTCTYPKPNWVEQDVDMIVAKSMEATKDAITKAGIDPADVAGVSFSTQRCCTIFVDKDGGLVRPMISWQDNRTSAELEQIRGKLSDHDFYKITSFPQSTTWMLSKILWLQNNEPENWSKVDRIVQLHDYTAKAWGAENFVVDYPDAVFYGLWNPVKCEWDDSLLELAGVSRNQLPTPMTSGQKMGTLSAEAAEKTGLLAGTPLCVGAGDQNAAAVGAGIVVPGTLSVSLGTAGLAAAFTDTPYEDPNCLTMVTNHAIEGAWQVEGYQAGAGGVLRWFRDEIAHEEKAEAEKSGKDVYEILNEMAESIPAGSNGLVLMPYLASATTPRWNASARGTLLGLTLAHNRACLVRAFMEGIILEVNDMINALVNSGVKISDVHILGGATKSKVWNQIQSDVYNRAVKTLDNSDAAPLGAAILAGVGVGIYPSIKEGALSVVKTKDTYSPIADNAEAYASLYEIYCSMYDGLQSQGVFDKIAVYQEKHCAEGK